MRLLIVGSLNGQLTAATRIALDKGASVLHADGLDTALKTLRSGRGADLVMIDVLQPIQRLIAALEEERIAVPVVACGIATDAKAAVAAIRAGAKEYIPLPPDAELIAAVLSAVSAALGGTYRIRVIHGYHGGTELRSLVRNELSKNAKVLRAEAGLNPGETDLILREF